MKNECQYFLDALSPGNAPSAKLSVASAFFALQSCQVSLQLNARPIDLRDI